VKADLGELRHNLESHLDDLAPMQRVVMVETFFEERTRAEVAQCHGISTCTYDNHLQAAFRSLRHPLTQDADASTSVDRSFWYDRIEELCEGYAATRRRRASAKKGEPSNFEGDRSNSEHDRGKNARAGAAEVAVVTES
jgi:hypothetical protein